MRFTFLQDTMSGEVVDLCIHEMTAAWCSICKSKDKRVRSRWREQMEAIDETREAPGNGDQKFVKAKYDGLCQGGCGGRIEEGDWIAWDVEVDGWVGTCCKAEG